MMDKKIFKAENNLIMSAGGELIECLVQVACEVCISRPGECSPFLYCGRRV